MLEIVKYVMHAINNLPNDKTLDKSELKAFADDNMNMAVMMENVFHSVENIVGNGENVGYGHFLLFPQCFQKTSLSGSSNLKAGIMW